MPSRIDRVRDLALIAELRNDTVRKPTVHYWEIVAWKRLLTERGRRLWFPVVFKMEDWRGLNLTFTIADPGTLVLQDVAGGKKHTIRGGVLERNMPDEIMVALRGLTRRVYTAAVHRNSLGNPGIKFLRDRHRYGQDEALRRYLRRRAQRQVAKSQPVS